MKLWIKYIIGIILGIAAYYILPVDSPVVSQFIEGASEFSIRFGRYTLVPMLLFGISYSFFKLRETKQLTKTIFWTFSGIISSTLALLCLGIISIIIIKIPRFQITGEKITEIPTIDIKNLIMQMFPYSSFDAINGGMFVLPVFVLAGFFGAGCASDKIASKPIISLIESATKLCYTVSNFFVEWISAGMIAITCYWFIQARGFFKSNIFVPLSLMLLVDLILFAVVICPVALKLFCRDPKPFNVLYASICPVIAAFFSADSNFSLQVNMHHGRGSLGIHEQTNNFVYPLFSVFGRGGTALVISICFVTILRSYSLLGFVFSDIIWLFVTSFGISFVLGAIPSGGTFLAIGVLCTIYGRGFEAGYLLLRTAAPILCSFAAAFDAVSAMYGSYLTAVKTKSFEHIELKHFV